MLVNLRLMLGVIVDIILMRRGPEHLPASNAILAIVVVLFIAVYALATVASGGAPRDWPLQLLVSTVIALLWFRLALVLLKKRERYAQTMTAFFGTYTLFLPALVPLTAKVVPYLQKKAEAGAAPPSALAIVFTILALWLLVVQIRIVHAAFEWPYFAAVLFIFGQGFVNLLVFVTLFGVPQSPG
jgi:hypothetical protein